MAFPYFPSRIGATSISEVRASWMAIISIGLGASALIHIGIWISSSLYTIISSTLSSSWKSEVENFHKMNIPYIWI
jgi:hypothetical protein